MTNGRTFVLFVKTGPQELTLSEAHDWSDPGVLQAMFGLCCASIDTEHGSEQERDLIDVLCPSEKREANWAPGSELGQHVGGDWVSQFDDDTADPSSITWANDFTFEPSHEVSRQEPRVLPPRGQQAAAPPPPPSFDQVPHIAIGHALPVGTSSSRRAEPSIQDDGASDAMSNSVPRADAGVPSQPGTQTFLAAVGQPSGSSNPSPPRSVDGFGRAPPPASEQPQAGPSRLPGTNARADNAANDVAPALAIANSPKTPPRASAAGMTATQANDDEDNHPHSPVPTGAGLQPQAAGPRRSSRIQDKQGASAAVDAPVAGPSQPATRNAPSNPKKRKQQSSKKDSSARKKRK